MGATNIILITIDSLRADHVGCCTQDRELTLTPNLDRFAEKGVVFTQAYSQGPATMYSMPSLFTGCYSSPWSAVTTTRLFFNIS